MSQDHDLFPRRLTRRDFLGAASTAVGLTVGAALGQAAEPVAIDQASRRARRRRRRREDQAAGGVTIGQGQYTFTLDEEWGALPSGMSYGFGCAVVVDSQDRVFVTSRSTSPCVAIFGKDGSLLETWSKDLAGYTPEQVKATAHGLYWSQEPDGEFLYWTENVAGGKDGSPRIGARVYKTDLNGRVLYTLGNVDTETSTSQKFDFTNPTDVAVAPNGDIYVVDGYGSQLLTRFDKNFKPIKTIGGKGTDHGQFNTCHGIWINTLRNEPEVYVADRANDRIEVFALDLTYKRTIPGVRKPCCFYQHKGLIYIPELGARVSILDADDQFVARLGDGEGIKPADIQNHPDKFATPHALTLDRAGNLYVLEWLPYGRPRKFRPTPSA